jgi:hypothetical protein
LHPLSNDCFNRKEARNFGIFIGSILIAFALYKINYYEKNTFFLTVFCGFLFIVLGFLWPRLMFRLRKKWIALGGIMHKIMMPLVMGVLFLFIFTPLAIILRITGRDPLRLKLHKKDLTYWISIDKVNSKNMKEQF